MSVRVDVVCDACSAAPRIGGTVPAHSRRALLRRRGWRCQVAGMEGKRRSEPGRFDFCGDCLREWDAEVAVRGPVMPGRSSLGRVTFEPHAERGIAGAKAWAATAPKEDDR